ncbi:MAG: PBP1A family penicillin-binding protein [Bdellovibrionaceae bacterium]|nr:PBP1A family penicillin-binding protein [Pseudobdellovibrionaceae bacterium]
MLKKILILLVVLAVFAAGGAYVGYKAIESQLPPLDSLKDYEPLLVTQVYDRTGKKIGEFFNERRILVPYDQMPKDLINAFLAAEDDQFFQHKGVNWVAIARAFFANLRAGSNVQGASTITQQVAKTLLLSAEKTYTRKIREIILAHRMEEKLSKEEILYLYLNQIYFGQSAYGVEVAAETYFRKPAAKLTLGEMAILAGLPKAPSAYSPIRNPVRAKERQVYVLNRMADVGYVTKEAAQKAAMEPIKIFVREKYEEFAPYFLETVRQMMVVQLGGEMTMDKGLKITTSIDLKRQLAAQEATIAGLKALDKRQGYRGALENITEPKAVGEFLLKTRNQLIQDVNPERIIQPNGTFVDYGPLNLQYDIKQGLPFYLKQGQTARAVVSKVDDANGLVFVRLAELEGIIDLETMQWARKPNADKRYDLDTIKKPSAALKMGDVILAKVTGEKFFSERLTKANAKKKKDAAPSTLPDFAKYVELELDQEPAVEGALISFDQSNDDILAMVGGTNFEKSKYNRAIQAARQTGSSYKALVYAAALDRNYTPATPIMDAPIVYDEGKGNSEDEEGQGDAKAWKPSNHSKSFGGDIILRNALVKSLNIPSVKIIEDIGVPYALDYSKRLGIYSPLNPDFTLVLGSSSVTLYEMTKVFGQFGKLGKRLRPVLIKKVEDRTGKKILDSVSLDLRFEKEIRPIEDEFETRRKDYLDAKAKLSPEEQANVDPKKIDSHIFFDNPDQLIRPQTAYLVTSLLKAVVEDRNGTGGRARAIGREVAGKTGTTNNYVDAWFIGYTQQISTGVWVGFDQEKSLGKGEVGGRAALPIWVDYMKVAHEDLPLMTFPVPEGIVFANIDGDTGELAGSASKNIIRQAFLEGTEPKTSRSQREEDTDFYKQDLQE